MDCSNEKEAYFICALLNSTIGDFSIRAFYGGGGGGIASPRVLQNIRIPKFSPQDKLHLQLAELSEKAHKLAKINNEENLREVEEKIDELSAQIWGLTHEELKEVKSSLEELR